MNLASLDLNLLVALDALVSEAHVGRAAARVGLSQPAMSHAPKNHLEQYVGPVSRCHGNIRGNKWQMSRPGLDGDVLFDDAPGGQQCSARAVAPLSGVLIDVG